METQNRIIIRKKGRKYGLLALLPVVLCLWWMVIFGAPQTHSTRVGFGLLWLSSIPFLAKSISCLLDLNKIRL